MSGLEEPSLLERRGAVWALVKPAGWLSHPAKGTEAPDVLSWAREALGAGASLSPAHRLDLETSGVLLCAEDPRARARLGEWFAAGQIHKEYQVLVYGRTRRKGIVRAPLADDRRGRALEAVTRYKLVSWLGSLSHLRVSPETGRKHQIRRHLQGLGHPVVGDARYGPRRFVPVPGYPGRLWLHAGLLRLPEGEPFEAPLPEPLRAHLALLAGLQVEG